MLLLPPHTYVSGVFGKGNSDLGAIIRASVARLLQERLPLGDGPRLIVIFAAKLHAPSIPRPGDA